MKIIWLCNVAIPKITKECGLNSTPFGGWLVSVANTVISDKCNELTICFPRYFKNECMEGRIDNLVYYGYFENARHTYRYNVDVESQFERILKLVS
ncbi:MAG: hypothetical protein RR053_06945, partial [Evtepia sp.]